MTCFIRRLTALLLLPAGLTAHAGIDTTDLDRMTVSASKSDRPVTEIAAPVTVVDDEEIERTLTESIRDMIRYTPGVDALGDSRIAVRLVFLADRRYEHDGQNPQSRIDQKESQ